MKNSLIFIAIISLIGLFYITPLAADDTACLNDYDRLPTFEALKAGLIETEIEMPSPEGSEGASALLYKDHEGKLLFIHGYQFLTYGPWETFVDLRVPNSTLVDVTYTFYGSEDGTPDFSMKNPAVSKGRFVSCSVDIDLVVISQELPKAEGGFNSDLTDMDHWNKNVKSLIETATNDKLN